MTMTATGHVTAAPLAFAKPSELDFIYTTTWSYKTCGVAAIAGTTITMQHPCFDLITHDYGSPVTTPVYIENAVELADEPGEWASIGNAIEVRLPAGTTEAIAGRLEQLSS